MKAWHEKQKRPIRTYNVQCKPEAFDDLAEGAQTNNELDPNGQAAMAAVLSQLNKHDA